MHTVEQQTVDGDMVATRATVGGTHGGPLLGVAPTGRRIEAMLLMLDRVVEGRIVQHHALLDWLALLGPIGAIPAFGPGRPTPAG